MKFFSNWQPLIDEDAHTALTFGFFRHAPTQQALQPWLRGVLGRDAAPVPLEHANFWPSYDSRIEGRHRTEPEMVFEADDGGNLLVIVEVKPGLGMHTFEQISREVVDVTTAERAPRVALIMIGADLGEPAEVSAWRSELATTLREHALDSAHVEMHYSSWRDVGHAIEACGREHAEWRAYAADVVAHLRFQGLLGYDGGPVFDDLEELNVVNAVEAYNRTIRAARQLLLALHAQQRFQEASFLPFLRTFALVRDGTSSAITQHEDFFTTTVALSPYRKAHWPAGAGVFVAFDLAADEEPQLLAGAFHASSTDELVWSFATAEGADDIVNENLARTDKAMLPYVNVGRHTEWVAATRPWRAGDAAADVAWALEMLSAGARAWD